MSLYLILTQLNFTSNFLDLELLQIKYCAVQDLYRRTISTVGSFIIDLNKDYKWFRLRELFITKFKLQFKRGFPKEVVTTDGRLQEWS